MALQAGKPAEQPKPAPTSQPFPSSILWSVPISAATVGAPLVDEKRVFIALQSGALAARNLADGSELWATALKVDQPPGLDENRVIASTGDTVVAVGAEDGKEQWKQRADAVTAPPLVRGGWVILATKGTLSALHAGDGTQLWSREMGTVTQRPTIDGETLFVPIEEGRMVALSLKTGETIWEQPVARSPTEPFVSGDRLYFATEAKEFVCLSTKDGERAWSFSVGARVIGQASADDARVYFVAMDNIVRALDRVSGNLRWRNLLSFRPLNGPTLLAQHVAVGGLATDVLGFDRRNNQPSGKLTLPDPVGAPPTFVASLNGAPAIVAVTVNARQEWKLSLAVPPPPKPPGDPKN
jgi:outer membrane protein assembly factor BamB